MNFKRNAILFLIAFVLFLVTGCSEKKEKPTDQPLKPHSLKKQIIDDKLLENLSAIHEGITYYPKPNIAAFDKAGNMYYQDRTNHRYLMISNRGTLAGQFCEGGINSKNLNNPDSIFIKDNDVYILDDYGRKIKYFCSDGSYRYGFPLNDIDTVQSIFVDDKYIYLNAMYRNPNSYTHRKLITILSKDEGKIISEVGELIKTKDVFGYYIFNRAFITVNEKQIFVAFKLLPSIVSYDLDGKEKVRINLRKINMPDVQALDQTANQKFLSTNQTASGPSVRAIIYCNGFAVDKNGDFYYACNNSFYRFDGEFNLKTRYTFVENKVNSYCFQVIIDNLGDAWGLISKSRKIYRFRFPDNK